MYKDEVLVLHEFLVKLKIFLEGNYYCKQCFTDYNSFPVRHYHLNVKKKEHEEALDLLLKGFERFFRGNHQRK